MYVLSLEHKKQTLYWKGKGEFTKHLDFAKKYSTWENASYWCDRIKRWKLKYSSIEDEIELIEERLKKNDLMLLSEDWRLLERASK